MKNSKIAAAFTFFLIMSFFFIHSSFGGKDKKKQPEKKEEKSDLKGWKEATKNCRFQAGLFPIYQDSLSGKTYLAISKNHVKDEFIYVSHVLNGILDAGYFTGYYGRSKIFTIEKYFDRIDFYFENTSFYFDPDNAMSKAADANINRPLIGSEKIISKHDSLGYLIEADKLFLAEIFEQIKRSPNPKAKADQFKVGNLSKDKKPFSRNQQLSRKYGNHRSICLRKTLPKQLWPRGGNRCKNCDG